MYIANLQIKVDTTDLERAKKELEGLSQVAPKVRQSTDDVSKAYDEAGKGAEKLSKAGERLVARVQEQVATFGKAKEDVIAYKAGLLGVGDAVNPLVESLRKLKAQQQEAVSAQKAFVAENKTAAREQEKLSTAQNRMVASLKEEIALFGKSKDEILLYRAGLMGVSDQVEPLIRELQRLKQAKEEESKAGVTSSTTRTNKRELERKALADEAAELEKIIALERERIAASNAQASTKPDATRTREAEAALESYAQRLNLVNQRQKEVDSSADQLGDEYLKLKYSIDPVAKSLDEVALRQSRLKELFRSGKLNIPRQEYETLNASLEASRKRITDLGATTGKTSKEINFALRGLPAQFTDIFVSLQGGQQPITVLLQQGGQLKDMFGGIGPAARAMGGYILGLVNPLTIAAAAVGALSVGWYQGQKEATAYNLALVSTGNAAGVSVDGLGRMAQAVGEVTGNVGEAAKALTLLANNSKIDVTSFETVAQAVIGWSRVSKVAVEDLVKEFTEIAEAPVDAVVKLNEKYNFLTADIYNQIDAMVRMGDTQGAVEIATNALANTHKERTQEMLEHLGTLERGWAALKGGISNFWDSVRNIGREETEVERLTKELAEAERTKGKFTKAGREEAQRNIDILKEELEYAKDLEEGDRIAAQQEAFKNKLIQEGILARKELGQQTASTYSQTERINKQIAENEERIQRIRESGLATSQDEAEYTRVRNHLTNELAKAEQAANKTATERATQGERLLASLRERRAILLASVEKEVELTKEQTELKKLNSRFAELELAAKTRTLTKDEQSVLKNKDKAIEIANQNIALEKQRTLQDALSQVESYRASLNDRLAASQKKYQDAVLGAGKSKKEVEYLRERNALQEKYLEEQKRIEEVYMKSSRSEADRRLYEDRLTALREYHEQEIAAWEQSKRDLLAIEADWRNGAKSAWGDYLDNVRDVAGETYNLFSKAFKGIEDYLVSFITGTKASFKDLLRSLAADVARMGVRELIGNVFGGQGGTNSFFGSSGSSSGGGGFGNLVGMARNLYSVYNAITGVGAELVSGYASGGLSGAASAGVNYYGTMLSNAYSTIAQWFGGAATSAATSAATQAATSAAANVGYGLGQQLVTGTATQGAAYAGGTAAAGSAAGGGLFGSILSSISGMLTNPVTWITAGIVASGKAFDAGYRADASSMAQAGGSNAILQGAAWTQAGQSKFFEILDKGLTELSFGLVNDKLAAMISGSSFHQMLWEGVIFGRLFGSGEKYKRTVGSAQGSYSGGEYTGMGSVESWFGGARKFGEDFDQALHGLNETFSNALGGLFSMFDVDSDIMTKAQARLRRTSGRLATVFTAEFEDQILMVKGQFGSGGNVQKGLQKFVDQVMGNVLAQAIGKSSLPEYLKEQVAGLKKAEEVSAAITGLIQRFEGVNKTLEVLNLGALDLTDAGLRGADSILAMVSAITGLEDPTTLDKLNALGELTSAYYDQFFTEAEKTENTLKTVASAFEQADIVLADSREEYRRMVEAIDITTEAGQQMFLTMMTLAGQADAYYDILESQSQGLLSGLMSDVSASFAALQRSIAAQSKKTQEFFKGQLDALNEQTKQAQDNISSLTAIGNSLDTALKRLQNTSASTIKMLREQANATLQSALSTLRSGGSLIGFEGLQESLDVASQMDTKLYTSLEEFEREQGRTANIIAELEFLNGRQLSTEEKILRQLQEQIRTTQSRFDLEMAKYDRQLAYAQSQLDALNGIDNSILSVGEAMRQLSEAITAVLNAQTNGQGQEELITRLYQSILGSRPNQQGIDYWSGVIGNSNNYDPLIDALNDAAQGQAAAQTYIEEAYNQYGFSVDAEGMRFWTEALAEGVYTFNDLIQGLSSLRGYSTGGYISGAGTSTSDSILARLSDGEFVMRASAVDKYGVQTLQAMNEGNLRGFSSGGYVSVANTSALSASDGNIVKTVFEKVVNYLDEIRQYSRQTTKNTGSAADSLRTQNEVGVVVREGNK